MDCKKKRKLEDEKNMKRIVEFDIISKRWLIEWDDKSRSWEDYENIKDMYGFKQLIQGMFRTRNRENPSYIS